MTQERWIALNKSGDVPTLDEVFAGWHYCPDWDFLLVGPGMKELHACCCNIITLEQEEQS